MANDAVTQVLAGQASYDELPAAEQALVRAAWDAQLAADAAALDFEARHLVIAGWTGRLARGRLVQRCAVDHNAATAMPFVRRRGIAPGAGL